VIQKIKNIFQTEGSKLRKMGFTEARQYLWEYYKFHLLIFVLITGMLIAILLPSEREYLYIAWLIPDSRQEVLEQTSENLAHIVNNPNRDIVAVTSYARTEALQVGNTTQQRFTAMLHVGGIDIFITPQRGVLELAEAGFLLPMHSVMEQLARTNPTAYNNATEHLLTITYTFRDEPENTEILAIAVGNTPFFENINPGTKDLYFTVAFNTSRVHRIAEALEVIFG